MNYKDKENTNRPYVQDVNHLGERTASFFILLSFGDLILEATRKTPLYSQHVQLNAKMVNFGAWAMPVFYTSVLAEHHVVRNSVGLFDVSHMGEIRVQGPESEAFLNSILVNDVRRLNSYQGQYSAFCNEKGGMVDDIIIYKLGNDDYFLCVNASNIEKDFTWIQSHSSPFKNLKITNASDDWAQLALQGPLSLNALKEILNDVDKQTVENLSYMQICSLKLHDQNVFIARTGYTGEKGFEIYLPVSIAKNIWISLLEKNEKLGIKPIGLGARDTLRLESCYLLYGNDMNDSVSPVEAGISWAVKFNHDFIGKDVLLKQQETGAPKTLVAFKMLDSGIPRHGMKILHNGNPIGVVTSGSVLPTVGGAGGMALLNTELINSNPEIFIDIRGSEKRATITSKPLYKTRTK